MKEYYSVNHIVKKNLKIFGSQKNYSTNYVGGLSGITVKF